MGLGLINISINLYVRGVFFFKLFLFGLALLFFSGCSAFPSRTDYAQQNKNKYGWINENSFRVAASGKPQKSERDIDNRRFQARKHAVRMAQRKVMQKFKTMIFSNLKGMVNFEMTGIAIEKEFGPIIKSGRVVRDSYDNKQNCLLVYEVSYPGLKKKVFQNS